MDKELHHKDVWTLDTFRALMDERIKYQSKAIEEIVNNVAPTTPIQQVEPNVALYVSYTLDFTKTPTENIIAIQNLLIDKRYEAMSIFGAQTPCKIISQTLALSRNDELLLKMNTNAFGVSFYEMLTVRDPELIIELIGNFDYEVAKCGQEVWNNTIYNSQSKPQIPDNELFPTSKISLFRRWLMKLHGLKVIP